YQLPDDGVLVFRGLLTFVVRTPLDIATMMPAITSAVHEYSRDEPVYNFETLQDFVSGSMGRQRFSMLVLLAFAGLALTLASIGTYGVVSYSTAQRAHEIGLRIALGAKRQNVLRLVIGQGLGLAFTGVVIGSSVALILARSLPSFGHLLYGIRSNDPLTIAGAAVVLLTTAGVACYLPARRAAKLDPLVS